MELTVEMDGGTKIFFDRIQGKAFKIGKILMFQTEEHLPINAFINIKNAFDKIYPNSDIMILDGNSFN